MSKIFPDDWESAGAEVLGAARARLAAYTESIKDGSIREVSGVSFANSTIESLSVVKSLSLSLVAQNFRPFAGSASSMFLQATASFSCVLAILSAVF